MLKPVHKLIWWKHVWLTLKHFPHCPKLSKTGRQQRLPQGWTSFSLNFSFLFKSLVILQSLSFFHKTFTAQHFCLFLGWIFSMVQTIWQWRRSTLKNEESGIRNEKNCWMGVVDGPHYSWSMFEKKPQQSFLICLSDFYSLIYLL